MHHIHEKLLYRALFSNIETYFFLDDGPPTELVEPMDGRANPGIVGSATPSVLIAVPLPATPDLQRGGTLQFVQRSCVCTHPVAAVTVLDDAQVVSVGSRRCHCTNRRYCLLCFQHVTRSAARLG